jgi:hypothetical protein
VAGIEENGIKKPFPLLHPTDGIAKHRTGNASRNGHIGHMVIIYLRQVPVMK